MNRVRKPAGVSLVTLILLVGVIGLVSAVNGVLLLGQQAQTRDAIRLADMARLEAAFALLSYKTSSYAQAAQGCPNAGDPVSQCTLGNYLPTITSLDDPGKGAYRITEVPTDTRFGVSFTLERGFGSLAKGTHTLTPDGIR